MKWPNDFPEGCPPGDAQLADGTVYRVVMNNPPTYEDFFSYKVINPHMDYGARDCQARGLSVYRVAADANQTRRRVPALRSGMVAEGNLDAEMGVIKDAPMNGNSHITWWVPEEVQPQSMFVVVQ